MHSRSAPAAAVSSIALRRSLHTDCSMEREQSSGGSCGRRFRAPRVARPLQRRLQLVLNHGVDKAAHQSSIGSNQSSKR